MLLPPYVVVIVTNFTSTASKTKLSVIQ